jgi:hypothetical protein
LTSRNEASAADDPDTLAWTFLKTLGCADELADATREAEQPQIALARTRALACTLMDAPSSCRIRAALVTWAKAVTCAARVLPTRAVDEAKAEAVAEAAKSWRDRMALVTLADADADASSAIWERTWPDAKACAAATEDSGLSVVETLASGVAAVAIEACSRASTLAAPTADAEDATPLDSGFLTWAAADDKASEPEAPSRGLSVVETLAVAVATAEATADSGRRSAIVAGAATCPTADAEAASRLLIWALAPSEAAADAEPPSGFRSVARVGCEAIARTEDKPARGLPTLAAETAVVTADTPADRAHLTPMDPLSRAEVCADPSKGLSVRETSASGVAATTTDAASGLDATKAAEPDVVADALAAQARTTDVEERVAAEAEAEPPSGFWFVASAGGATEAAAESDPPRVLFS